MFDDIDEVKYGKGADSMTDKDVRLIEEAITCAIEAKQEKLERLEAVIDEFDIPEPNEIKDGIWDLNHEINELQALSSRMYHAKVAELTKGSR